MGDLYLAVLGCELQAHPSPEVDAGGETAWAQPEQKLGCAVALGGAFARTSVPSAPADCQRRWPVPGRFSICTLSVLTGGGNEIGAVLIPVVSLRPHANQTVEEWFSVALSASGRAQHPEIAAVRLHLLLHYRTEPEVEPPPAPTAEPDGTAPVCFLQRYHEIVKCVPSSVALEGGALAEGVTFHSLPASPEKSEAFATGECSGYPMQPPDVAKCEPTQCNNLLSGEADIQLDTALGNRARVELEELVHICDACSEVCDEANAQREVRQGAKLVEQHVQHAEASQDGLHKRLREMASRAWEALSRSEEKRERLQAEVSDMRSKLLEQDGEIEQLKREQQNRAFQKSGADEHLQLAKETLLCSSGSSEKPHPQDKATLEKLGICADALVDLRSEVCRLGEDTRAALSREVVEAHELTYRQLLDQGEAMARETDELQAKMLQLRAECDANSKLAAERANSAAAAESLLDKAEAELQRMRTQLARAQEEAANNLVSRMRLQRELASRAHNFRAAIKEARSSNVALQDKRMELRQEAVDLGMRLQAKVFEVDKLVHENLQASDDASLLQERLRQMRCFDELASEMGFSGTLAEQTTLCEKLRDRLAQVREGFDDGLERCEERSVVLEGQNSELESEAWSLAMAYRQAECRNEERMQIQMEREQQAEYACELRRTEYEELQQRSDMLREELQASNAQSEELRNRLLGDIKAAKAIRTAAQTEMQQMLGAIRTKNEYVLALQQKAQFLSGKRYVPGPEPPDEIDAAVRNAFASIGISEAPPVVRLSEKSYLFGLVPFKVQLEGGIPKFCAEPPPMLPSRQHRLQSSGDADGGTGGEEAVWLDASDLAPWAGPLGLSNDEETAANALQTSRRSDSRPISDSKTSQATQLMTDQVSVPPIIRPVVSRESSQSSTSNFALSSTTPRDVGHGAHAAVSTESPRGKANLWGPSGVISGMPGRQALQSMSNPSTGADRSRVLPPARAALSSERGTTSALAAHSPERRLQSLPDIPRSGHFSPQNPSPGIPPISGDPGVSTPRRISQQSGQRSGIQVHGGLPSAAVRSDTPPVMSPRRTPLQDSFPKSRAYSPAPSLSPSTRILHGGGGGGAVRAGLVSPSAQGTPLRPAGTSLVSPSRHLVA